MRFIRYLVKTSSERCAIVNTGLQELSTAPLLVLMVETNLGYWGRTGPSLAQFPNPSRSRQLRFRESANKRKGSGC